MAIQKTKVYLVNLFEKNTRDFFAKLFIKQLHLETLDPKELGEEWHNVHLTHQDLHSFDQQSLDVLKKVIDNNLNYKFWEKFEDVRGDVSISDLSFSQSDISLVVDVAHAVLKYEALIDEKAKLDKKRKKKKYIESTQEEYDQLCLALDSLDKYLSTQDYDTKFRSLNQPVLKKMILAYTQLELEKKIIVECSNIFKLEKGRKNQFVFIAVSDDDSLALETYLKQEQVDYQHITWIHDIVTWKNKKPLSAFQGIAQSIGTLGKNEFDPTLIIGFFFSLFFALSINDALYGLIITLLTGFFIYFRNLKSELKNIFTLFFYSGLMSIFVGALSNSWGGDLFKGTPIGEFLSVFQIIEPIVEPERELLVNSYLQANGGISPIVAMLGFAVGVGLLHIFIAYLINVLNNLKSNQIKSALFETSWIAFLLSLLAAVFGLVASTSWLGLVVIVLAVSSLGLFIFNNGKTLIMKFAGGLIKMYDLIGFMADMLSYTRLIAVGLTGSIIAVVINLLAGIVTNMGGPVVGFLLGLLVLLVGHTFNLVVSLFGAYINPLRLHYVEFMPKFYQGKSRSLQPLNQELSYAKIKK